MEEMNTYSQFITEKKDAKGHGSEKHAVMAFGRMNPPTAGHEEVVKKMHEVAKEHGAEHHLVLSHSEDKKKNPLPVDKKVAHAKNAFPGTNVRGASKDKPTILHHAADLHKSGVQHLHVVAGSDRHQAMHDLLHKYNDGKEHAHGSFKFKSITLHSSGERDPDSEGTAGVSGTKMREHASSGNKKDFHANLPKSMKPEHKDALYHDLRHHMGIKEEMKTYKELIEGDSYISKLISRHRHGEKLASTEHELVKTHLKRSKIYTKSKNAISSEYKEEVQITESHAELNKHISDFSKGVNSSSAKNSTYKKDNKPIHNMKHVETDSDHQKVFDHLKKMGYKKSSGYDPKPHEFDMHHNREEMTSKSDPVHHASGISAHIEKEHGGKTKVHFTHRHIKEEQINELSSELLSRYKEGAKKSADELTAKGQHRKAGDRWLNVMKATGKQIEKTTAGIKKALHKEETKEQGADRMKQLKNFKQMILDLQLQEVLSKDASAGDWIHDFVHSDNPKFAGKSKEKRKQMALAAYYAKQRNEEVEQIDEISGMTTRSYMQKARTQLSNIEVGRRSTGDKNFGAEKARRRANTLNKIADKTDSRAVRDQLHKATAFVKEGVMQPSGTDKIETSGSPVSDIGTQNLKVRKVKSFKFFTTEEAKTGNPGFGYHGQHKSENDADAAYAKIHAHVKSLTDGDDKTVKHYLDSAHGRHLVGHEEDHEHIKKDFKKFKKHYRPEMHEEVELSEAGGVGDSLGHLTAAERAREIARRKAKIASNTTPANKKFVEKALSGKPVKEEAELDEAFINGREYASHGLMHPDHAKWQSHRVGVHTDFYAHGTGDKINGQVMKNDGKEVHIKATKTSGGKLHKFKVTPHLPKQQNEEVDLTEGLDPSEVAGNPRMYSADTVKKAYYHKKASAGDKESLARHLDRHHGNKEWRKPVKEELEEAKMGKSVNVDKVNIAGDTPHEEKWEPAKKKMKKESLSFSDFLKQLDEKLIGKQKNIDKNKNGKLDKQDFEMLRKEETEVLDEIKMADLPGRQVKGRSYGADYEDPEGAFETKADMKKAEPKKAGRKVGQKVGARANLGNSKLHRA